MGFLAHVSSLRSVIFSLREVNISWKSLFLGVTRIPRILSFSGHSFLPTFLPLSLFVLLVQLESYLEMRSNLLTLKEKIIQFY